MMANWIRWRGLQSTLAPTSSRMAWPASVGRAAAMAGGSTPARGPRTTSVMAMTAPVFPALTTASASPLRTRSTATRMEESFFFRRAVEGDSPISTTSEAWRTLMGRPRRSWRSRWRLISSWTPTRITPSPSSRAAAPAPLHIDGGAGVSAHGVQGDADGRAVLQPRGGDVHALRLLLRADGATAVGAALGTGSVGPLRFVALGAGNERGGAEGVVGAALAGPGVAVAAFRQGHGGVYSSPGVGLQG